MLAHGLLCQVRGTCWRFICLSSNRASTRARFFANPLVDIIYMGVDLHPCFVPTIQFTPTFTTTVSSPASPASAVHLNAVVENWTNVSLGIPSKDMKRDIPHLLNRILRFAQVIQVWNASFLCCTWSDGVFAVEGRHDLPFVLLKVPACFSTCSVLGKRICPADFASASPHQACRHSFASHSPIPKGRGTVASALYYVQPFKALIAESTVQ